MLNGVSATRRRSYEPAGHDHVPDSGLAGLGAEGQAHLLGERGRRAQQRRERVVGAPDRVEVVLDAVAGLRLDDHPGAPRGERRVHVTGRADRIAHVVQAVEHGDQVVLARVGRRGLGLEPRPLGHPGLLGAPAGRLQRAGVGVEAGEARTGKGLGHQHRRGAVAAADVGDPGPPFQLLDDTVQRGQPRGEQVGVVPRPEEAFAALVDVVDVLAPAEARATADHVQDLGRIEHRADRDLKEAGQVGGAVGVGERDGLLGGQVVAAAVRVVGHEAAGRLGVEPLAHVALVGVGGLGQLTRRERARAGQRAVQAELVAHDHQRRVERGSDLVDGVEDELHQLVAVDRLLLLDDTHG